EEVRVGPGSRSALGMELNGEEWAFPVSHALDRAVVQIPVRHLELRTWEGVAIDREAVVLRRDVDAPRAEVFDGLVPAAVPEFQFERRPTEGEGQQLVAEADPEDRDTAREFLRGPH